MPTYWNVSQTGDDRGLVEATIGCHFGDSGLLVRALTHTSYASEHGLERSESNERLEYLGDAILKAVVAGELVRVMGDADEGKLSKVSAQVVSGLSLARVAREMGLDAHVRLGHGEESTGGRTRTRNLAGVMEAVIGALYLDSGFEHARAFIVRAMSPTIEAVMLGPASDYKTALQEEVQGGPLGAISYRIVRAEGPPHRPCFTAEALIGEAIAGSGEGSSKRQAEQEAARSALASLLDASSHRDS
ncbi:MAG: ribonuclease III [Clostridia bacterium]|nr:ribonuclease III [Clostridia bacterium]